MDDEKFANDGRESSEIVRKRRKARKWTIVDLARASGVNKATISAIENGHRFRSDTLARLMQALEMTTIAISPREVTSAQWDLLTRYTALSPTRQALVDDLIHELSERPTAHPSARHD